MTFSKEDSTIRFWNITTGLCVLSRRYYIAAASTQAMDPSQMLDNPSLFLPPSFLGKEV